MIGCSKCKGITWIKYLRNKIKVKKKLKFEPTSVNFFRRLMILLIKMFVLQVLCGHYNMLLMRWWMISWGILLLGKAFAMWRDDGGVQRYASSQRWLTGANLRSGPHSTFLESFLTVWAETCTIMTLSSCGVSVFFRFVLAHMSRQPAVLLQGCFPPPILSSTCSWLLACLLTSPASQQVRTHHRSEAALTEQLLWAVGEIKTSPRIRGLSWKMLLLHTFLLVSLVKLTQSLLPPHGAGSYPRVNWLGDTL